MRKILLFILIQCFAVLVFGKPYNFTKKELKKVPPRIIRSCCAFGTNLKVAFIPFVRYSDIGDPENIGSHTYLGNENENNGILYTLNGGFIDLGHVRDIADWTAYLYSVIELHKGENYKFKIGYEGGKKILSINIPEEIEMEDQLQIAADIAFQFSMWHEISTWFGASSFPFVKERFSSFSVEDAYSNLLGSLLAIEAIKSDLPYEEAMTNLLNSKLKELEVIPTFEGQKMAMEQADNVFYTSVRKIPSGKILLEHNFQNEEIIKPLLLENYSTKSPLNIHLSKKLTNGCLVSDYYSFTIRLNCKLTKKTHSKSSKRLKHISQKNFKKLVTLAELQINKKYKSERIKNTNQRRYKRRQQRNLR